MVDLASKIANWIFSGTKLGYWDLYRAPTPVCETKMPIIEWKRFINDQSKILDELVEGSTLELKFTDASWKIEFIEGDICPCCNQIKAPKK